MAPSGSVTREALGVTTFSPDIVDFALTLYDLVIPLLLNLEYIL